MSTWYLKNCELGEFFSAAAWRGPSLSSLKIGENDCGFLDVCIQLAFMCKEALCRVLIFPWKWSVYVKNGDLESPLNFEGFDLVI